jgi:hypothetical protein
MQETKEMKAIDAFWNEPDYWADEAFGLKCMMRRNGMKAWCGYVAVPKGHPMFGKDYDDVDVRVHGGLTWGMDHAPGEQPNGWWWFGFDCSHSGDWSPRDTFFAFLGYPFGMHDTGEQVYRTFDYVRFEVESLAIQLDALK